MEQPQYLIDTNAVIDYLGKKLPEAGMSFMNHIIDAVPNISVITRIEVLGFNAPDEHYQTLIDFVDDSAVLGLSTDVADKSIAIRKAQKTKLPDTIIAATALVNKLTLISRNKDDFKNIDGLETINPYELK
ncbi:MAG: type II toxin-antitoxin system VapC family toxin [Ginsengibacter sp.]